MSDAERIAGLEAEVERLTAERDEGRAACRMVLDQRAGAGVTRAQAMNAVARVAGFENCEWFDPALRAARNRAEAAERERDEARASFVAAQASIFRLEEIVRHAVKALADAIVEDATDAG
jgi:hypothetical protein